MVSSDDASLGDETAEAADVETEPEEESGRFRVGERTLTVLATPLNVMILRALGDGPLRLSELRKATGLPAQTTLRGHLASLIEFGLADKRPTDHMPFTVENELTSMGRDLLDVANLLEGWLARAPGGPIALDGGGAKGVIKAFVEGWRSTMMQGMAAQPMSLTELDRGISNFSYPALERRLASMRMAGLVEAMPGGGTATPYTVTEWGRRGVTPLIAASRCEEHYLRDQAAPIPGSDVEAALMLVMPLLALPIRLAGSCRLEVIANGSGFPGATVTVTIEAGRVVACAAGDQPEADSFAAGSAKIWLAAIGAGDPSRLSLGGEELAQEIVGGLHTLAACR